MCEIKALITLLVYDDVLLKSKRTTGNDHKGTWKKAKVKLNKDFVPQEKDQRWKSKINKNL